MRSWFLLLRKGALLMFVSNMQNVESILLPRHFFLSLFCRATRFVVSEISGTAQERDKLSGGLVFTDLGELAETCRYYLQRPQLRAAIASRGRQLFERQVETDILSKPVEVMLGKRENVQREIRHNRQLEG